MIADCVLRDGGCVVLLEDFDAAAVLEAVERERISHLFLLPPLLYQLMDHPDSAVRDTSSLRSISYGGCQSSPARIADAIRRFGPVLVQFYGQNEAGGISLLTARGPRPRSPGPAALRGQGAARRWRWRSATRPAATCRRVNTARSAYAPPC